MRLHLTKIGFLLLLLMVLAIPLPLTAQEDARPVITPENAHQLAFYTWFDLSYAPRVFEPAWLPPGSDFLYIPTGEMPLQLVDIARREYRSLLGYPDNGYFGAVFNPTGTRLALLRWDVGDINQLEIWNLEEAFSLIGTYASETTGVVSFNGANAVGDALYFSDGLGANRIDIETGTVEAIPQTAELTYPILAPDGTVWASHERPQTIILTEAATGTRLAEIELLTATGVWWGFSPDSRYLVAPSNPYRQAIPQAVPLQIFDAHTGDLVREMDGEFWSIRAITFTPDSKIVAAVVCAEFEPISDPLITSLDCGSPEIWLWETVTGQQLHILSLNELATVIPIDTTLDVIGMAFSPDGTRLAATLTNKTLIIWQVGPP